MRVARIIEQLPPVLRGKEIHGAELSRALAARGIEQHVFARAGDPIGGGVRLTLVPVPAAGRVHPLAGWCAAAARAVVRAHRTRPFDLVHAHGDFLEAAAAAWAGASLGIPALLTVHGGLSDDDVHDLLRLATYNAMEIVFAVSGAVAGEIAAIGVGTEVIVRSSAVREALFETPARPLRREIVTVGRLDPMKGLETLVAAHDALADPSVAFTIVGDGHGAYAERIRELVAARPAMRIVAADSPEEVGELLAGAALFALPSVPLDGHTEGTPTAVLEALAVGTPVVASDVGGIGAALAGGRYGTLVPPGDGPALAAALATALADPAPGAARAAAARAAGAAPRWADVATVVGDGYEQAVERHRATAALFTLPLLDVGGAERVVVTLANGARYRGLRAAVAAAPGPMAELLQDGVEHIPLARRGEPRAGARNLAALSGAIVRLRPAAVNAHHLPTGMLAGVADRLSRALSARPAARRVMTVHFPVRASSTPIVGAFGGLCFDAVLPVAEHVRQQLTRAAPPWRRGRFTVVRAGVQPPAPVVRRERTVGMIGRLIPGKGHAVLLDAWDSVRADPRAAGWTLEIWGEGPEGDAVRARAARSAQVVIRGEVPSAGARAGELELVVLPSFREGLPLALAEAMAAGVPVIATALPGIRELVPPDAGLLVAPGDPAALAAALLELIGDPDRRRALGAAGREHVARHYGIDAMVDQTLAAMGLTPSSA